MRTLRVVAGTLLAGYGGLILLRLLAHESRPVGALLLLAGLALLAPWGRTRREPRPENESRVPRGTRWAAGIVGATCAGGILAYNAMARSTLELPEWAILAYGVALLVALPYAGRPRVDQAIAWSFPLVAAPLGMYALDAALDATHGGSPLDAFIQHALVAPMSAVLSFLGFQTKTLGQTVLMTTPRGTLALTVGVVCAGLQPGVLFLGVLGLHGWQNRTPPPRLAALLALGLVGVYLANVLRLVVLALVGHRWGGEALVTAHANAGWLIFVAWMLLYWWVVLRRLDPTRHDAGATAGG